MLVGCAPRTAALVVLRTYQDHNSPVTTSYCDVTWTLELRALSLNPPDLSERRAGEIDALGLAIYALLSLYTYICIWLCNHMLIDLFTHILIDTDRRTH